VVQADIAPTSEPDFVKVGSNKSGLSVFLNLGDPTWRTVYSSATGWQVVDRPDVLLRQATALYQASTPETRRPASPGRSEHFVFREARTTD
jgi:hypothetical protein